MPADESSQIWLKTKLNLKKLKTTKKCWKLLWPKGQRKDPEIRINFTAHLPHPEVTIHSPVSSLRWDAWIGNWMWSTTPILHQVPPGVRVSLFTASICGTKKGHPDAPKALRAGLGSWCFHHQHVFCPMSLASHLPKSRQKNEVCPETPVRF